jgi:DNA-binding PadR family transcriptional regulator
VTLADLLGLTAGNLSRNLTVLEEHGYVVIEKTFKGRRPRTWVLATDGGKAALDQEVRALRSLLDRLEGRDATGDDGRRRADGGSPVPTTS